MHIPYINLSEFDYKLSEEKIAKYPLEDRSASKLLVVSKKESRISESVFKNSIDLLSKENHLVFNKTKVIKARLLTKKITGGLVEVMLINPISPSSDPQIALVAENKCTWKCMIGGRRIESGSEIKSLDESLRINVLLKDKNFAECEFSWDSNQTFLEIVDRIGNTPLPPYLKREAKESDIDAYQTVYAKDEGSVAAPTAGLHFTDEILEKLMKKGVNSSEITLHVGAGTFKPIKDDNVDNHDMHQELINVPKNVIEEILENVKKNKKITTVGTTSIRTLESIAIFGEKLAANPDLEEFFVDQWDAYNIGVLDRELSLDNVLNWMNRKGLNSIIGETKLFIVPEYSFRMTDAIFTNFHQPKSTLILLVAAFLGKDLWKESYDFALNNNFRFLSYGDSSLLIK